METECGSKEEKEKLTNNFQHLAQLYLSAHISVVRTPVYITD